MPGDGSRLIRPAPAQAFMPGQADARLGRCQGLACPDQARSDFGGSAVVPGEAHGLALGDGARRVDRAVQLLRTEQRQLPKTKSLTTRPLDRLRLCICCSSAASYQLWQSSRYGERTAEQITKSRQRRHAAVLISHETEWWVGSESGSESPPWCPCRS